uniref:NADH-ubiquinone oxidoreductase chain 1 n=1 Tax=Xenophyes cascus TaxID=984453 RepID=A0A077UP08_9HEMI|nr:NADH-ubiquinone oxidoreductase chain 1 [Xenophyes cascus]
MTQLVIYYLGFILLLVVLLIEVSFFTLFERSVLGYIQLRKGPNSVGYQGMIQPFSDAISLFTSESLYPLRSAYSVYFISPLMGVFLSLIGWFVYPFVFHLGTFSFGVLYFMCVSSIGVYVLLASGWSSSCTYSVLGCMRAVAQTISYEINLMIVLMSLLFLIRGFDLMEFSQFQSYIWFVFWMFPLFIILLSSLFAETNRAPFDFAEAESELVSGFNVEYSGGGFAFIFMAEYLNVMLMGLLINVLFLGGDFLSFIFFIDLVFIMFLFIWIRGSFPRYRYDKLMGLAWSVYLPICLNLFVFFMFMSYSLCIFILLSKVNKSI